MLPDDDSPVVSARAEQAGKAARAAARDATRSSDAVAERLDQLTLVCMALWSLLREKTNLTEEDLMERVKQIDLADGSEDGKLRVQVAKCADCGRVLSQRHRRCMYCGADKLNPTAFDATM